MYAILTPATLVLLLATPAIAQDPEPDPSQGDASDITEGVDMLSEGARRLLRGLMGEVEPEMRDVTRGAEVLEPRLDLRDLDPSPDAPEFQRRTRSAS